ncbi:MAG: PD-(D/E)XK nuclease family protein [Firmicutes bacterium]|nr:PD-(D/E)XK nuclease family protein [Bacillota bacterium]
MLKILLGPDPLSIRREILRRVAEDVRAERRGRVLLVPELVSHDTERRLCEAAGDSASLYAEVLTFTRLARRVAESGTGLPPCMDSGGRIVTMAAAARQLHGQLKTFAAVETKPAFLEAMVEAVDEFKRCCISSADLQAASRASEGVLAQKLEELSALLAAYDALCAQGKRDPRDQMNLVLDALADGDYAQRHSFYIDSFPDFSRQHLAILEHLIRFSPEVTVGVPCDAPGSRQFAFERAGETAADLLRIAKGAGIACEVTRVAPRETPTFQAAAALFQGTLPDLSASGAVRAWQADGMHREIQAVAEEIVRLVEGGARYREIGILCADIGAQGDALRRELERFGIPLYQAGTEDVLQKRVVSALLSALEAALGGMERRDVLKYLRSCLSPIPAADCDRLENYAVIWNIQGSMWEKPWRANPEGLGARRTERTETVLAELNELRAQAVQPLVRLRDRFAKAENLAAQVRALYDFMVEIDLPGTLGSLAARMDARAAQILQQLWEILLSALEQLHDALGRQVWEAEQFVRLLTLLLSCYDVGTIPPVLDAVQFGAVSAMRCHEVRHLFVLGAVEGVMPGYGVSTGVLTDLERGALRALGVPITGGAAETIKSEFSEIFGAFCCAVDTLTVSYPGAQCSYVYRRIAQMAGGETHVEPRYGPALTSPAEAAALLAARGERSSAASLGLLAAYDEFQSRRSYALGTLERGTVAELYGHTLLLSASSIDQLAECRLAYFFKYGLRAKELREATVDPAEFGSYIHAVLEKTSRRVMALGGFHAVSLAQTLEIAREEAAQYRREHFFELDSDRLSYLFARNSRELEMVVEELWRELSRVGFEPRAFELYFGAGGEMESVNLSVPGLNAALRGIVDRIDLWEHNGSHYFRVVDYKSGKKDFDYCDIFNGVGLQMLLYLFALRLRGESMLGRQPIPAGVQYFPARAPLLRAESKPDDEAAAELRRREWRRKGLLLDDAEVLAAMDSEGDYSRLGLKQSKDGALSGDLASREDLAVLERYVGAVLSELIASVASGDVSANPYTRGSAHDACAFCPYGEICRPASVPGRRNYKAMTAKEFWDGVRKKVPNG